MAIIGVYIVRNSDDVIITISSINDYEIGNVPPGYPDHRYIAFTDLVQPDGQVYDSTYHIAYLADSTTGAYLGWVYTGDPLLNPVNAIPAGTTEVPTWPGDTTPTPNPGPSDPASEMTWDFVNDVWHWSKQTLKRKLYEYRIIHQEAGITVEGRFIETKLDSTNYLHLIAAQGALELDTDTRALRLADWDNEQFTNLEMADILNEVQNHLQRESDAEATVSALIDNGTITLPSELPAAHNDAYDYLILNPLVRTLKPTIAELLDGKVDKEVGKGLSENDYTDSDKAKVATIDSKADLISGLVPSSQLPSYVDDVLEYANFAALPVTGESGKIYLLATPYTLSGVTSSQFRWSGSAYAAIIASPGSTDSVTEGSTNLYFTTARARAAARMFVGTTEKTGVFPVAFSGTVASGNLVIHLTNNGLSGGAALFPNGNVYLDSLQLRADNESDSPHMFGTPVLSNSNKTLTIPVKKSTGLNVALLSLTLLGAPAAANGSVIKGLVYGD